MPKKHNIAVTEEVWQALNQRKEPGDSFDDVQRRLLGLEGVEAEAEE